VKKFELTQRALGDLRDIWEYMCEDSFDAADRVHEDLFRAFAQLVDTPGIGHKTPGPYHPRRSVLRVHSYLIVYRDSNPLRIVRVVHGRRDVEKLLNTR
jgi:plasmid stabilization system protein ParE